MFRQTVELALKVEQRVNELRAITGMSEAEAHHWLVVLYALPASSATETPDSVWEKFRWGILEGGTPAAAAAEVVKRMRRPDFKGLRL